MTGIRPPPITSSRALTTAGTTQSSAVKFVLCRSLGLITTFGGFIIDLNPAHDVLFLFRDVLSRMRIESPTKAYDLTRETAMLTEQTAQS